MVVTTEDHGIVTVNGAPLITYALHDASEHEQLGRALANEVADRLRGPS